MIISLFPHSSTPNKSQGKKWNQKLKLTFAYLGPTLATRIDSKSSGHTENFFLKFINCELFSLFYFLLLFGLGLESHQVVLGEWPQALWLGAISSNILETTEFIVEDKSSFSTNELQSKGYPSSGQSSVTCLPAEDISCYSAPLGSHCAHLYLEEHSSGLSSKDSRQNLDTTEDIPICTTSSVVQINCPPHSGNFLLILLHLVFHIK